MGCIKTFLSSFATSNGINNINEIPDISALNSEQWKDILPADKELLMNSYNSMPGFVKKVVDYLKSKTNNVNKTEEKSQKVENNIGKVRNNNKEEKER